MGDLKIKSFLSECVEDVSSLSTKDLTLILLKLIVAGALIGFVITLPGIGILVKYFPNADRNERQRIKRTLKQLHRDGYIQYDKNNLETYVMTTKKGDVFMNEEVLFELSFDPPERWNKKWFVVMFDIPTKKGKVRRLMRLKLLEIGFILYQDSVYVFPHECRPLIRDMEKILGVKGCVQTIVTDNIDGEANLKRQFGLK